MRTRDRYTVMSLGASLAIAVAAAPAAGAPRVLGTSLERPAVTGAETALKLRAVDPDAPVGTISVAFGSESFAISACMPPDSAGRAPGPPFTAGSPVTLRVPHTFTRTGPQAVVARVDSGGCERGGTIYQPVTVTPTRRGEPPVPLLVGVPVTLPTLLPTGPGLPGGVDLPGPPALPGLPSQASFAELLALAAARCPDAHRRIGPDTASRRRARRAALCAINAVRRARRLRPLRENSRLRRAATGHSRSMVRRRYFSHVGPGGVVLIARLRRVRYLPARQWRVGENLANVGRRTTPLSTVRSWLASPPHRAVLLQGAYREIGLGLVSGRPNGRRGTTVTADFGFRR